MKNLEHPERTFEPDCAVTSLSFSLTRPNYLSVGLFNGNILLYNVHHEKGKVVLDTRDSQGKHTSPVWQMEWVRQHRSGEKGEVLFLGYRSYGMFDISLFKGARGSRVKTSYALI